jgi:hypothetical protein
VVVGAEACVAAGADEGDDDELDELLEGGLALWCVTFLWVLWGACFFCLCLLATCALAAVVLTAVVF